MIRDEDESKSSTKRRKKRESDEDLINVTVKKIETKIPKLKTESRKQLKEKIHSQQKGESELLDCNFSFPFIPDEKERIEIIKEVIDLNKPRGVVKLKTKASESIHVKFQDKLSKIMK